MMRGQMDRKRGLITLAAGIGILATFLVVYAFPARGQTAKAATIHAASCSYADVSTAIASAQSGDTVIVPAGNCTWSSGLTITKGIYVLGAGAGATNITCTSSRNYVITYQPSDLAGNHPFRVSGFTFDMDNQSYGIELNAAHSSDLTIQTNIRIDHNTFTNTTGQAIWNNGMRGVIDNNTFSDIVYPIRHPSSPGNGERWWDNWDGILFGAEDNNMYIEDNTFTGITAIMDCQYANRYAFRYNTVIVTGQAYPLLDMHGNQGEGYMYACFGGEVYGNDVTMPEGQLLDQRGGKAVVFYNRVNGSTLGIKVREEYDDARNPTINPQPQHVSDSYYWNNRAGSRLFSGYEPMSETRTATGGGDNYLDDAQANFPSGYGDPDRYGLEIIGGTGTGQYRLITDAQPTRLTVAINWLTNPDATSQYRIVSDCCNVIAENSEFYNQKIDFDGTVGVGCGTISSRPATCTPGVAYWATEQSCTAIDDANVGAHPTTPISGTLYKCIAPNTWTAYFTPYTYPHPLRGEAKLEGDVTGDGLVDINDIRACVGHILGIQDWGNNADVNEDGRVDVLDVQRIAKILSEK
jgi:hypothetical protein